MTPKEKAEKIWMELFQKQIDVTGNGDGNLCVEMALIAVDEIINEYFDKCLFSKCDYWQEVKKEIINL
jgi:hypothetical protein